MTVNIAGTFKKDQRDDNGLEAIAATLEAHPHQRHYVVGLVETVRTTVDHADGGSHKTVVRFVALEPAIDTDSIKLLEGLLENARKARDVHPMQGSMFDDNPLVDAPQAGQGDDEPTD